MSITLDDWLAAGYRRYDLAPNSDKVINKHADFLLQRRIDDTVGKKYFMTVYCYDRKKYPIEHQRHMPEIGFMVDAQFVLGDHKPFFGIQMNAVSSLNSIAEIEEYYEKFWQLLGCPYYETWEEA